MSSSTPSSAASLTIRPVTAADWPSFVRLFESPGGPKNCWCMVWRGTAEERREFSAAIGAERRPGTPAASSQMRRAAMESRIRGGMPVGLLAYAGDEPVAWCSIAPRPTYRRLGGKEDFADRPEAVWSIACFFVAKAWRGQGLTRRLIEAAVATAADHGAEIVEAYPVAAGSPSYRFMGFAGIFAAAGFEKVGTAGHRRTAMRLAVGRGAGA